jgi:hypothetical protein
MKKLLAGVPGNGLTLKIIIGWGEKNRKPSGGRKCLNGLSEENSASGRAAAASEKVDLFAQIARWLPDVQLLCSRVKLRSRWLGGLRAGARFARLL